MNATITLTGTPEAVAQAIAELQSTIEYDGLAVEVEAAQVNRARVCCHECDRPITRRETVAVQTPVPAETSRWQPWCLGCAGGSATDANTGADIWPNGLGYDLPMASGAHWQILIHLVHIPGDGAYYQYQISATYFRQNGVAVKHAIGDCARSAMAQASEHQARVSA